MIIYIWFVIEDNMKGLEEWSKFIMHAIYWYDWLLLPVLFYEPKGHFQSNVAQIILWLKDWSSFEWMGVHVLVSKMKGIISEVFSAHWNCILPTINNIFTFYERSFQNVS